MVKRSSAEKSGEYPMGRGQKWKVQSLHTGSASKLVGDPTGRTNVQSKC